MMTPHQRICRAVQRGTGCRLSTDDIALLAQNDAIVDAIATVADADDEKQYLPPDEAEHYDCYVAARLMYLIDLGGREHPAPCGGDGWYRCVECGRYSGQRKLTKEKEII